MRSGSPATTALGRDLQESFSGGFCFTSPEVRLGGRAGDFLPQVHRARGRQLPCRAGLVQNTDFLGLFEKGYFPHPLFRRHRGLFLDLPFESPVGLPAVVASPIKCGSPLTLTPDSQSCLRRGLQRVTRHPGCRHRALVSLGALLLHFCPGKGKSPFSGPACVSCHLWRRWLVLWPQFSDNLRRVAGF